RRRVVFDASLDDVPVYWRPSLRPGDTLEGPAIVEEFGSTTVVFPSQTARVDEFGNLLLERSG
ncbi:MAG: hypothetical protein JO318_02505, partial [Chloroflexi bacterium]|nr:hypothetical protein [Chloroflexota bacterium]